MPCLAKALDLAGGSSGSARDPAEPRSAPVSEMSACFLFCGKDPFERAALTGDAGFGGCPVVAAFAGMEMPGRYRQIGAKRLKCWMKCVAMISIDVCLKDISMCVYCMMDTLGH